MGASGAAECWDCHGSHDILPSPTRISPVFKMNLPATCAKCHSNAGLTKEYRMNYPEVAAQYMDSIHGKALLKMGLIVAPSCNDCHGVHDIKRAVDRDSPINHANVAKTCGKCHVGVEETYDQSIHGHCWEGRSARAGLHRLPYRPSRSTPPRTAISRWPATSVAANATRTGWSITGTPITARPWRWASRTSPPSGRLLRLPRPPRCAAAFRPALRTCPRPTSWPRASKCHPGATAKFTEYDPHANPQDGKIIRCSTAVFLAMTGLLIGMFAFFGVHTLVWLVRAIYLYLHDSKTFREPRSRSDGR